MKKLFPRKTTPAELTPSSNSAQERLEQQYPLAEQATVQQVDLARKQLTGELDLVTLPQLTDLDCSWNHLTALHLTHNFHLQELNCSDNQLTSLDLSANYHLQTLLCGANQLTSLDLTQNSHLTILELSELKFHSNLSFLSHLVNLTRLSLSRNSFDGDLTPLTNLTRLEQLELHHTNLTGSLQPLARMSKLEELNVCHTHLTSGLEYLPVSLKDFYCDSYGPFPSLFNQFGITVEFDFRSITNFPSHLAHYQKQFLLRQLHILQAENRHVKAQLAAQSQLTTQEVHLVKLQDLVAELLTVKLSTPSHAQTVNFNIQS